MHQVLVQVQVQPGLVTHVLQPNLNHYASVPLCLYYQSLRHGIVYQGKMKQFHICLTNWWKAVDKEVKADNQNVILTC